jgi:hypothetical protein
MKPLKIIFLIMLMALIFVLGWFNPVSTVGRLTLPEECYRYCLKRIASDAAGDHAVETLNGFHRHRMFAEIPAEIRCE